MSATRCRSSTSGAGRRSSSPPRSRCRSASRRRKEYAELEWPIDLAIAVVWVAFAVNFFWTIARRREKHLYVAIWFYIATIDHGRDAARRQQPRDPGRRLQELLDLRRRAGRARAVVVRPQRGRVLPDDAVPRASCTTSCPRRRSGRSSATGSRSSTSGRWSSSTSGPARTTCSTRRCPTGRRRSAWSSASCCGAVVGRHAQRAAHAARRLGQGAHRSGAQVLRRRRHASTAWPRSRARCSRSRASTRSSHYTDWTIGHVHGGALGWNGFMAAFGMLYWLVPAPLERPLAPSERLAERALLARDRRHPALRRRDVGRRGSRRA